MVSKNKDIIVYLDNLPIIKSILNSSKKNKKISMISMRIDNYKREQFSQKEIENRLKPIENLLKFGIDNLNANHDKEWKDKFAENEMNEFKYSGFLTTIAQFELGKFLFENGIESNISDDLDFKLNGEDIFVDVKTFADINFLSEISSLLNNHGYNSLEMSYENIKTIIENTSKPYDIISKEIISFIKKSLEEKQNIYDLKFDNQILFLKSKNLGIFTGCISVDEKKANLKIKDMLESANSQYAKKSKFENKKTITYVDLKNSVIDINKLKTTNAFYEILYGNGKVLGSYNGIINGLDYKTWSLKEIKDNSLQIDKNKFKEYTKIYDLFFKNPKLNKTNGDEYYSYISSEGLFLNNELNRTSGVLVRSQNNEFNLFLNPFADFKIYEQDIINLGLGSLLISN